MATEERIDIKNREGLDYLSTIPENSIDLVITDPPYIISRETPITTR
jgi:site-specific DNA-methyltransferase (adenine-specific)